MLILLCIDTTFQPKWAARPLLSNTMFGFRYYISREDPMRPPSPLLIIWLTRPDAFSPASSRQAELQLVQLSLTRRCNLPFWIPAGRGRIPRLRPCTASRNARQLAGRGADQQAAWMRGIWRVHPRLTDVGALIEAAIPPQFPEQGCQPPVKWLTVRKACCGSSVAHPSGGCLVQPLVCPAGSELTAGLPLLQPGSR